MSDFTIFPKLANIDKVFWVTVSDLNLDAPTPEYNLRTDVNKSGVRRWFRCRPHAPIKDNFEVERTFAPDTNENAFASSRSVQEIIKPFKTMPSGNTDTAAVSEALAAHGYTVLPNGTMVKKENNSK